MSDAEHTHRLDQAIATLSDLVPRIARAVYDGFKEQQFRDDEAMAMTTAVVETVAKLVLVPPKEE